MLLHLREGDMRLARVMYQDRMQENQNLNSGLPDSDPSLWLPHFPEAFIKATTLAVPALSWPVCSYYSLILGLLTLYPQRTEGLPIALVLIVQSQL